MYSMINLNNKEIKEIHSKLEDQFEVKNLKLDYLFYKNKDNKIFLITKNLLNIDLTWFRVNSFGLYFGKIENSGFRLSISGTQLIGNKAGKNIFETDKKEEWLNGQDLECDKNSKGWVLIKSDNDFLGCGYCKNGRVMNFIPKSKPFEKSLKGKNIEKAN